MKRLKIFVLFLLVILFIATTACSRKPSPYAFNYPKEVTPQYCFENYRVFDPNIRYTECYEFVTSENNSNGVISGLTSVKYSAIKSIDDLSFMVCYKTSTLLGTSTWTHVVRRNDCNIEPILNYTPSKIELCSYDDLIQSIDVNESPETYYRYSESTFSEPILTIDSPEAIAEIMAVAQRSPTLTTEENRSEQDEYPSQYDLSLVYWQEKPIYVKISFEECAGIVWVGKLLIDNNGKAYLERWAYVHDAGEGQKEAALSIDADASAPFCVSRNYPLGEYMDAILAEFERTN